MLTRYVRNLRAEGYENGCKKKTPVGQLNDMIRSDAND